MENKITNNTQAEMPVLPVLIEKTGKVGWLYLNRPQAMNGIDAGLIQAFHEALAKLAQDDGIHVIVLSGMGKAFCAGGDVKTITALQEEEAARLFVEQAGSMTAGIMACPKPVIAMVNGAAAGAGFNIALACDLIFAAESAKFIQSFAAIGLVPDCGGHKLLADAVGPYKAKELIFTGRPVTAQEAEKLGFVNAVYSLEDLKEAVHAFAQTLAEKAPLALKHSKALLQEGRGLSMEEVLQKEAAIQAKLMLSADCKEGLAAFFEKRPPLFIGK